MFSTSIYRGRTTWTRKEKHHYIKNMYLNELYGDLAREELLMTLKEQMSRQEWRRLKFLPKEEYIWGD